MIRVSLDQLKDHLRGGVTIPMSKFTCIACDHEQWHAFKSQQEFENRECMECRMIQKANLLDPEDERIEFDEEHF